jgi:hypothetical protein
MEHLILMQLKEKNVTLPGTQTLISQLTATHFTD